MKDEHMLPETQQKESGVTRLCFLKTVSGAAVGIGVSQRVTPALVKALEKEFKRHPILWAQRQGCTGCSVSLLNSVDPSIADVLLKVISLQYHPTVMASEGETALENLFGIAKEDEEKFSLVVEGDIPTAAEGKYCVVGANLLAQN